MKANQKNIGLTYSELYAQLHRNLEKVRVGNTYDVIVVGVGSMGSSACYHLAKRGFSVLGLEQFDIPHEQGSHAGQSRLIRKAYGEDTAYVPLLQRAYENWKELESETGSRVYFETGLTYFGNSENTFLDTVRASAQEYDIPLLAPDEKAYTPFRLPEQTQIIHEPEAGFLTPERSIMLMADRAIRLGADIRVGEAVLSWQHHADGVTVQTAGHRFSARKIIFTSGAWTGNLIPELRTQLKITRQVLAWVQPQDWKPFELGTFPCWFMEDQGRDFYGFPVLPTTAFGGPVGLKVALHYPGQQLESPNGIARPIPDSEPQVLIDFMERHLPTGFSKVLDLKTCLYTNSPDTHFILDHLPGYGKDVVIGAGFSGHGFKFVSAIGEILADLTVMGQTSIPIQFLSLNRFNTKM
ncbi:N-methyl-L-tryptophan oxidase [Robiginitalea sp.]|nr:N-methyl-L-tryptophan oxidase [Robiginitalea sp.]